MYVDRQSRSTAIKSGHVTPGKNEIRIPTTRISPGNHTIIFHTPPQGRYRAMSWAKIFTIYREPQKHLNTFIAIAPVLIGPPFIAKMHGIVNCSQPYTVIVNIDGTEVLRIKSINNSLDLPLHTPLPLLVQKYEIEYRIIPQDSSYKSAKNHLEVYAINLPLLLLVIVLSSAITAAPPITTYIASYIRKLYSKPRQHMKNNLKKPSKKWPPLRFKKPRLLNLYKKFLKILKTISESSKTPSKSETLREFINTIDIHKPMREIASEFIRLYEVDLYSQHEADARKAGEIINELEKKARK
ncbi:MAG: hypothetical protein DRJ35_08005 [Thermoprotei archaeon]|nr:MAG: hypothetical protein DRJ35_08005 [Thermoprotei archaeon]